VGGGEETERERERERKRERSESNMRSAVKVPSALSHS
jgi:hypothetical protein